MLHLPSLIVFGPQSKKPGDQTLKRIHAFIRQDPTLHPVVDAILGLPKLWTFFAAHDPRILNLEPGIEGLQALSLWMATGDASFISNSASGIVALPLLAIVQTAQYFQLLRKLSTNHEDLVQATASGGGVQGFCSGFLMAVVVSSSSSEESLADKACNAIRLAVGIGIYSDLGVGESNDQVTLVVRLKATSQAQEIVESCPSVRIAAVIDPQTITVISTSSALTSLKAYITLHGLTTVPVHLSGKVHNPENVELATRLQSLYHQNRLLMLEAPRTLKKVRSNASGRLMPEGSATNQVIDTILTSSCQWHEIMTIVAQELLHTGRRIHAVASFGLADCVPLAAFHEAGLEIVKIVGDELAETPTLAPVPAEIANNMTRVPSVEPVAIFGRSTVVEVPKTRIDIHSGYRASQDARWSEGRKFYGNFIQDVDAFDHAFFSMSSREAFVLDPQQRLLLETAFQAVESSGYLRTHHREDGDNVGVHICASFVDYEEQSSSHPPSAYRHRHNSSVSLR